MHVKNVFSRHVSIVDRETSLEDAAHRMRQDHVGSLIIVERRGGELFPVGIVTDRDIAVSVLAGGAENIGELLFRDPLVTATEDEDCWRVIRRMRSFEVRHATVIDHSGALVGILSMDDIVPALAEEFSEIAAMLGRPSARERERLATNPRSKRQQAYVFGR